MTQAAEKSLVERMDVQELVDRITDSLMDAEMEVLTGIYKQLTGEDVEIIDEETVLVPA